jgi:dolichol-phosphate mannosyltransferase
VKKISFIIPVYNEEDNIEETFEKLKKFTQNKNFDFEFIFNDNHSSDNTFILLKSICEKDNRFKVNRFRKNYGYQRSIIYGFQNCTGDAAIQYDCDNQDPLMIVEKFIEKWNEGYEMLYGIRVKRKESFIVNAIRNLTYKIFKIISKNNMPENVGDFRLIDKKVINFLKNTNANNIFIRGLLHDAGFKSLGIPYYREARLHGKSKFTFFDYFKISFDALINHSNFLLKFSMVFSLFIFFLFISALVIYFYIFFTQSKLPEGWMTVVILILINIFVTGIFSCVITFLLKRILEISANTEQILLEEKIN